MVQRVFLRPPKAQPPRMSWTARLPRRIEFISGLVEATLIFALCASFASTIFSEDLKLKKYAALGMQSQLLTATVVGFFQSRCSDLELSLAAPDIVPTLVISNLLTTAYASNREVEPNVANTLAISALCTVMTGLGCIAVGRVGLSSKANTWMPEVVFHGFVVVAGILIMSKGVKMSMPKSIYHAGVFDPESGGLYFVFALAGLPHGIAMFVQKRFNYSPADVILPSILLSPLLAFVVISVFTWGLNDWVSAARAYGWMLESGPSSAFYEPTASLYFGAVDWYFVLGSAPVLMIGSSMFLVGDIFFKSLGTIKLLDAKKSIDREMMLQGSMNVLSGLLGGVPGYSQMKLAAINICVVGKASTSRMPGLVSSAILCMLFLLAPPLIEYVPRFWLSGILYNVAIGFMVEGFFDPPMTMRQRLVVLIMVLMYFSRSYLETSVLRYNPALRGFHSQDSVNA